MDARADRQESTRRSLRKLQERPKPRASNRLATSRTSSFGLLADIIAGPCEGSLSGYEDSQRRFVQEKILAGRILETRLRLCDAFLEFLDDFADLL